MMFQAELKDTYWGADEAFKTFDRARERLLKIAEREHHKAADLTTVPNAEIPHPLTTLTPASNELSVLSEIQPTVDEILNFDFAFTDAHDFNPDDLDYS